MLVRKYSINDVCSIYDCEEDEFEVVLHKELEKEFPDFTQIVFNQLTTDEVEVKIYE